MNVMDIRQKKERKILLGVKYVGAKYVGSMHGVSSIHHADFIAANLAERFQKLLTALNKNFYQLNVGVESNCRKPLGMTSGQIPDEAIRSSSSHDHSNQAQINQQLTLTLLKACTKQQLKNYDKL
ncbi:hypothetical protein HELRODRAFT_183385 [Helobdella robusta]|uniref:Uncharacterized protein n=1 Tax=Helobdella robusta TaxID=6412 RepID=T1FJJ7_HELRO|nr:hypothetical protein HELRODRAFT_183385 [Helobdella robusta]ESO11282.1 hypothetical protein HELRODRAFT_183385 [Helobdella robusta]